MARKDRREQIKELKDQAVQAAAEGRLGDADSLIKRAERVYRSGLTGPIEINGGR